MSLNDVNFQRLMETAKNNIQLEAKLRDKRTELCLAATLPKPDAKLMDNLRHECHDLLDLILDNETSMLANVVKDELKKLNDKE